MARRSTASSKSSEAALDASTRVLVLHGPEEMIQREHLDRLRAALAKAHGELPPVTFDGPSAPLADVLDELRTYSLLQSYKLVVVEQAEEFVRRHREALERYVQSPVDQATLVLRSDTWRPGNLDKLVAKVGAVIKCESLSEGDARQWVLDRAASRHGREIQADAAAKLVSRVGVDLLKLDSELGKLAAMPGEGSIGPAMVQEMVGQSSEDKAWAVQEAILSALDGNARANARQRGQAVLGKLHELVDLAGQDEVPVTYAVADLMRKLSLGMALKQQGVTGFALTKAVGMWGPGQQPFLNVVNRLDPARAGRWFDRIIEADRRTKTGLGDAMRNLECFCALLTDEA